MMRIGDCADATAAACWWLEEIDGLMTVVVGESIDTRKNNIRAARSGRSFIDHLLHDFGNLLSIRHKVVMTGDTCGANVGKLGTGSDPREEWILVHRGV
jgi:hypothetical protein